MEQAVDTAPFYYFATDENELIIDVNYSLCTDLQFAKEEIIGKRIDFIFPVSTRIFYQTHFSPLLQLKGATSEIFISLLTKDKRLIPVLCNAKRNAESRQTFFAGIFVENRKTFENELIKARNIAETALRENTALVAAKKELESVLEQSEMQLHLLHLQNEELKQFNHALSHELQEPLRKLSVYSGILKEAGENLSGKEKLFIDRLLLASVKIRGVVSRLQQYAWISENAGNFYKTDINEIIQKAKKQLAHEFPDVTLTVQCDEIPVIEADATQIELLIYQVLLNSIQFRKEGNHAAVFITWHVLQMNVFKKTPGRYKYEDHLKIDIRDEGQGFDAQYNEEVFKLFGRAHKGSGFGIGLSLAKKVVENHFGKIGANSVSGAGAIITLFLPVNHITG